MRVEPNRFPIEQEDFRGRAQILAQRNEALPQTVTRLLVRTVTPQQRRELFAPRTVVRLHREIGDQPPGLSGSNRNGDRTADVRFDCERPEQPQRDVAQFGHQSITMIGHAILTLLLGAHQPRARKLRLMAWRIR